MKMEDVAAFPMEAAPAPLPMAPHVASGGFTPDVVQQLGSITRQLHDALRELGVMPNLQVAADNLPDVRSRLTYIAEKTASSADRVLSLVDEAKADQAALAERTAALRSRVDGTGPPSADELRDYLDLVRVHNEREDARLTEMMLAQDFQDLTGQVVQKVVTIANELEDNLVKLLVQVVPDELREKVDPTVLAGPVINAEGRTDVVQNQGEVDDLLASLGF